MLYRYKLRSTLLEKILSKMRTKTATSASNQPSTSKSTSNESATTAAPTQNNVSAAEEMPSVPLESRWMSFESSSLLVQKAPHPSFAAGGGISSKLFADEERSDEHTNSNHCDSSSGIFHTPFDRLNYDNEQIWHNVEDNTNHNNKDLSLQERILAEILLHRNLQMGAELVEMRR